MTRALRPALVLAAVLAVCLPSGWCQASHQQQGIYPLREVRPGQRAVAKSVFRGTTIESFQLEVLGVMHKFEGTRSVILARILDGPVVTRKSGVIAGMSGSPVYINGLLAGAIALAWSWSKEPITGITPIEEMLAAWEPARPSPAAQAGKALPLPSPVRVGGQLIHRVRVGPPPPQPDPPGVMTLVPLGGFVQASGFNQRGLERLQELVAPYGMHVVQGPGAGAEHLNPPLVPGAAVGVALVSGDFDMSALGTVTLVEGTRVLAFGHPLFQLGEVDLPMTGGYVYDILPSLTLSNKIMAPTGVVGRIYRDDQAAVAGAIGPQADLLPMTVEVSDRDRGRKRTFRLRLARLRELLPSLAASVVGTAVDETRGVVARGTARVVTEFAAEGRPPIRREDFAYSNSDAAAAAMAAALRPLATFTDNPLGELRFTHLRIRVETMSARHTATIERAAVAQSRIRAGDRVKLAVTLRPHGRPPVVVPVELALPPDLPRGQVRVAVSSGREADQARSSIGSPRPEPISLDQLIARFTEQDRQQDLVVQAALPAVGARFLGEELPALPTTALEALRAGRPTDLTPSAPVLRVVTPTDWALSGRVTLSLMVEGPAPPPGAPPPAAAPAGAEQEEQEGEEEAATRGTTPAPLEAEGTALAPEPTELAARWAGAAPPGAPGQAPPQKEEEPKPLARQPETWIQQSRSDYREAKANNVAVGDDGRLTLSPARADLGELPAEVVWSLTARDGAVYAGTGSGGVVYRIAATGEIAPFFATGELNVHALAWDETGGLYAATSPHGRLFRIAPDGSGKLLWRADRAYLWCLAPGPEGSLYVGAGWPARIYQVQPSGDARVVADLPASNVLALARGQDGALYAGTSDQGGVYRVTPEGRAVAIYQVAGTSVDELVVGEKGQLYASASPSGRVYRILTEGLPRLHCETGERTIHGLGMLPGGDLVAATGPEGRVVRIGTDGKPQVLFRPETGIATALAVVEGAVYVGGAAPAWVRRFGPGYPPSGSLESPVFDAQRTARWGRLQLTTESPEGTAVLVETRAGDSPRPDEAWDAWVAAPDGVVGSRPARYLQYRLTLNTKTPTSTPAVRQVRLTYQRQNLPPTIVLKEPAPGDRLAKKVTLKWEARDPDKDTLTYAVAISADLGATWKDLKKDISEPKYEWDTAQTADGRYLLRLLASDQRSQPADPQQGETAVVVWVDNAPPTVAIFRSSAVVSDDRCARVSGIASDKLSPLRSIEYRVDTGEWRSLPLVGIDVQASDFSVATDPLDPGERTIQVRAFDAAGNVATDQVKVTVKPPAEKPAPAKEQPAPPTPTPAAAPAS